MAEKRKSDQRIEKTYALAREQYAQAGTDTEKALRALRGVALSLHCWQGDDVAGFEKKDSKLEGGGIQVTGNYPGRARNVDELRADMAKAFSLIPGKHRVNLQAIYGEFGEDYQDRDGMEPRHFKAWIDWAKHHGLKLDLNSTNFSHPKANDGFTLSSKDNAIRQFWIEHVKACRNIGSVIGRELKSPCIHNLWIPDGTKDACLSRFEHRAILKKSLDEIFRTAYRTSEIKDALEGKLFGIGSVSFVVGSHDFYMGYAMKNNKMICLDTGHFHPTESIADKISAILQFSSELHLHVSRGVRWDSDHVVIFNDDIQSLAQEIVRAKALERLHIGLDFFDGSINRVGAWVIGSRSFLKGLLFALLEPTDRILKFENSNNGFGRLALLEEMKAMPFGAVWDYYCLQKNVLPGDKWIAEVLQYEKNVLLKRD